MLIMFSRDNDHRVTGILGKETDVKSVPSGYRLAASNANTLFGPVFQSERKRPNLDYTFFFRLVNRT